MSRDMLTGVYAKSALAARLDEEVHRGLRYGDFFAVLLLDLDHFKSVNDAFGHARGDAVLEEVVRRIRKVARGSDVLFRFGGDEFVLVLPRTTREQAGILARRLVEAAAATPLPGTPPLWISTSIGVCAFPEDGTTSTALFERADARMYEAKRGGRGRVVETDEGPAPGVFNDEGRLVERSEALEEANRFLDAFPRSRRGVLRVFGEKGTGRTRFLHEVAGLASLRGFRVLQVAGDPATAGEPFGALRAACAAAGVPGRFAGDPAEVAATLRRALAAERSTTLVVTLDDPAEADAATIAACNALVESAGRHGSVALVRAMAEGIADPAPAGVRPRASVHLAPLTEEGVRVWLRGLLRWEPPDPLVAWVNEHAAGRPAPVRAALLRLVDERVLLPRPEGGWVLDPGFQQVSLRARLGAGPPLRGVPEPRHPLVGREGTLRQVLRLLRETRLLTLCGPAGVGKTRLAVEAAREAAAAFADGVVFVGADIHSPSAALPTDLAAALELPVGEGDPWVRIAAALRRRQLLVVLDGFGRADGCGEAVARLLDAAPGVRVLATSRERLDAAGEWVFAVEGLGLSRWAEDEHAAPSGAVQLFAERAAERGEPIEPGTAEGAAALRVCHLVDGFPLGIELAAALAAHAPDREAAQELETALEGGIPQLVGAAGHHLRIRTVCELAWRRLPVDRRTVLRRASVFGASFDADAAADVAGARPEVMDALVTAGLVQQRGGRYLLHSLVREFASHKLDEFPEEREQAAGAFAAHYLARLRAGAAPAAELPNLRRAWRVAVRENRRAEFGPAAAPLWELLAAWGAWGEAEALFGEALRHTLPGDRAGDDALVGELSAFHGAALLQLGRFAEARERLGRARTSLRQDNTLQPLVLTRLAAAHVHAGDTAGAHRLAGEAVEVARRSDDSALRVRVLGESAWAILAGSPPEAVEVLLEAMDSADEAGSRDAREEATSVAEHLIRSGRAPLGAALLSRVLRGGGTQTPPRASALLAELQPDLVDAAMDTRDYVMTILPHTPASPAAS